MQAEPLQSISALSKKLQFSPVTIQKRINKLNKKTEKPYYFHVSADINYTAIGLTIVDVYLELTSIANFEKVEDTLSHYEYIKYISRGIGIGSHTGIFAQFTIPHGTTHLLKQFLDVLIGKGLVRDYSIYLKSDYILNKPPKLDVWDNKNNRWKLSGTVIEEWFKRLVDQPEKLPKQEQPDFNYISMDKTHLIILEELTWDARRSDREIYAHRGGKLEKNYEKPPNIQLRCNYELDVSYSTFARVMTKIDPHRASLMGYDRKKKANRSGGIIDGYRLHYSPKVFSIFDTCVFLGRTENIETVYRFYNLVKNIDLGLRMSFTIYENNSFMWYLPMPSQFFTDFVKGVLNYVTEDFQLVWLNYGSSKNFAFWPPNYDLGKHEWKKDRQWMVEGPIKQSDLQ